VGGAALVRASVIFDYPVDVAKLETRIR